MAYSEWKRFLDISYGSSFQGEEERFLVHSYLSMLVKLVAYEVLRDEKDTSETPLKGILDGEEFSRFHINNLVDKDFFFWTCSKEHFPAIKPVLRRLQKELWSYDFSNVDEDIFKGIYQELIDKDTRKQLGEYYTPSWLCQRIIKHLAPNREQRSLDPSCGSGSFLLAWLQYLKEHFPNMNAYELLNSVVGIDIHPLSVQIAKVTLILGTSRQIKEAYEAGGGTLISLPVYLANTLYIPKESANIFEEEYEVNVNDKNLFFPKELFEDLDSFAAFIKACDDLSEQNKGRKENQAADQQSLLNSLKREGHPPTDTQLDPIYALYQALKKAKEAGRDSLWRFIIENTCRPVFLQQHPFDYVMGNPPWVPFNGIVSGEYQHIVKRLFSDFSLAPRPENVSNMEMAALFLSYTSAKFLKPKGRLAFVLPRSFLSADQHENTRSGASKGFDLTEIWDFDGVKGLFNVPSCVLFTKKHPGERKTKAYTQLPGKTFSGKIPTDAHDDSLENIQADKLLHEHPSTWYHVQLGKRSAFANEPIDHTGENAYMKGTLRQGATIVPRPFYFVQLKETNRSLRNLKQRKQARIATDHERLAEHAKVPWKDIKLEDYIEPTYLYETALANNLFPFTLYGSRLVVLPVELVKGDSTSGIQELYPRMLKAKEIQEKGHFKASKWFLDAEKHWEEKKEKKVPKISPLPTTSTTKIN